MVARTSGSGNRILSAISAESRRTLAPWLTRLSLPRGYALYRTGSEIRSLFFVESGLVSLVKPMCDGRSVEISAIGREGIVTPSALFGAERTVMDSVVQIPATVLRIARDAFARALVGDAQLADVIRAYAAAAFTQLTQTAACNALHTVEERLCRWLLIAADSAPSAQFPLTHDFLAALLGVRRASVSTAAANLQHVGTIQYAHGTVMIRDRHELERRSCECYSAARDRLDSLFSRQ